MTKWDPLPNEILDQILLKVVDVGELYGFLLVKKQWFTATQAILYSKVTIHPLNPNEISLLNTLFNSKYAAVHYVKYITFKSPFTLVPPEEQVVDEAPSPLQLLMKYCPYVEQAKFEEIAEVDDYGIC